MFAHSDVFLSDITVNTSNASTDQAADRSGWTMFSVLVMKQTLQSVDTEDGELTTVITARMSPYRVLLTTRRTMQVRKFIDEPSRPIHECDTRR